MTVSYVCDDNGTIKNNITSQECTVDIVFLYGLFIERVSSLSVVVR